MAKKDLGNDLERARQEGYGAAGDEALDEGQRGDLGPLEEGEYLGKYRGVVITNKDPLDLGRIKVTIPALPQTLDTWAMPQLPYGGPQVGFHGIPPPSAKVWIEFERGNPSFPVWSGAFWDPKEFPEPKKVSSEQPALEVKMWKTVSSIFYMDDTKQKGAIKLEIGSPAIGTPVTMLFNSEGALLKTGQGSIKIEPETAITIKFASSTITLDNQGITLDAPKIVNKAKTDFKVEAGAQVGVKAGANAKVEATGNAEVKAGANAKMEGGAQAAVKGGGKASLEAGGLGSVKAGGILNIQGSVVKIN